MLSVVIPTLTGREQSLARAIKGYERVLAGREWELIVIEDRPTWPHACNEGFHAANGDVLHFSADDLEPLPGAFDEVLPWLETHDELPAPRCMNHAPDGVFDNAEDGPDGAITWFTRIPLLRRDQYERIGPWPEFNYVADIWLSEKARTLGIETRIFYSYAFVHYWEQVGRKEDAPTLALARRALHQLRQEM